MSSCVSQIHQKIPAVSVAADVWTVAFKTNFIPFWVHSSAHQLRASRLAPSQYQAIHEMNTATKLTLLLTDEERMGLQRTALSTPSSGIMTLEEVSSLLEINGVRGSSCNGGSKGITDAVRTIGNAGAKNAARILSFCRSAALSDELQIYDMGTQTARMQASALLKRVLVTEMFDIDEGCDPMEHLHLVPDHAKTLYACIQCKRVANAAACDGGHKWQHVFNEIGTSASMISVDCETKGTCMRCAKRSSASVRTAVAFEDDMSCRSIECEASDPRIVHNLLVDNTIGHDTGATSRVRRDSKISMEQRVSSVPCGSECMLAVPVVGKAVCIWNDWYALCAYCGCFVRFHPNNRLGTEICCMRCDYRLLHRTEKQPISAKDAAGVHIPKCRYCGKVRSVCHTVRMYPCIDILLCRVFEGRPTAHRREVETRKSAAGYVRREFSASSPTSHGFLLPAAFSFMDSAVSQNHANARDFIPHCLRSSSVLRSFCGSERGRSCKFCCTIAEKEADCAEKVKVCFTKPRQVSRMHATSAPKVSRMHATSAPKGSTAILCMCIPFLCCSQKEQGRDERTRQRRQGTRRRNGQEAEDKR
jgi:hypothetical protein